MYRYVLARMLESSTLTSGILALLLVSTVCYCVVAEIEVPEYLSLALTSVLGFFFGAKTGNISKSKASWTDVAVSGRSSNG